MKHGPLWNPEEPIIGSFLEQDVYKFLMMYFIWRFYPNLRVKFQFMNRTDVPLAQWIDIVEFRKEYEHARSLSPTDGDIAHIRSWGLFPEPFLEFLKTVRLPKIHAAYDGEQLAITAEGPWVSTTLCEMPVLTVVSELYTRAKIGASLADQERAFQEGNKRLSEKIALSKEYLVPFVPFGLRRRATGVWEQHTIERFLNEVPQCITRVSNVRLARELGVEVGETNAHELQMALYALHRHISDEAVRRGQYEVLEKWEQCGFGDRFLIMLTDTFGSPQFLNGLSPKYALYWTGLRQDSGDPFAYVDGLAIPFYQQYGIDPLSKWCMFTDGLDFMKMRHLHKHCLGRIQSGFGIGTNLTNDLGLFGALSIVMKLVEAAGNPAVKISDNRAKATGDKTEIKEAMRIFGYSGTFFEKCQY